MEFIVLQIFTAVGVFFSLIVCAYMPYCVIQYRSRSRSSVSRRSSSNVPVLSLCNCFAAGVFLATCFLGMVPHVRQHVADWNVARLAVIRNDSTSTSDGSHASSHKFDGASQHETPWTEILLIAGFLMILLIEELIKLCRRYCFCCRRGQHHHGATDRNLRSHLNVQAENEPLMSDGELGSTHRIHVGSNGKPGLESPIDSMRMADMDGRAGHGRSAPNGHDHHHHNHIDAGMFLTGSSKSLSWRSVALLLGLGIHGVFEGVALGLQDQSPALFSLLFGVMSHEALCAIAFGINLAGHRAGAGVAFTSVILFSLSIPVGMVAGFVVSGRKMDTAAGEMIRFALEGLAAGTFVYVAFMDMLAHELTSDHDHEDDEESGDRWRLAKVLCVAAGFLLFLGFTFVA